MKTHVLALLLVGIGTVGCRSGRLAPLPGGLDDHIASARESQENDRTEGPVPNRLEEKTRAILAEWDAKLAHPASLPLLRDFSAPAYAEARTTARSPTFAKAIGTGISEVQLLGWVFERNPRIRAAHLRLRASVNQYAQVTHLDTILSQYASFQRSSRTRVGMPLAGERIDQSFPFPGSIELKAALVKHAVEEARARYAGTVRDIVVEARALFARYVFVERAIAISEATLEYLGQLEDAARGKLSAGSGPKGAVIQVQVEIAALRNDLVTLRQDQQVMRANIARLVDLPSDTTVGPPTPSSVPAVPASAKALREQALGSQPDVQAADARVRRMQTMIELAEQTAYPPFSPGLSTMAGTSHETAGSDREREPFSTRPKIKPNPWFGSKEAYLREARESSRAAAALAVDVRNRTTFAVERARAALKTAQRLHRLYRDVQLAQAEQAYRDAAAGYAADNVEFLNVVDSLRRWLRFQLEADRAVRDLHSAHAHLEGAVGAAL